MSKHVRNFLPNFFKNEHWKLQLLSQWSSIVGGLSNKMRIEKIENTTLFIGVYHTAWLQELYSLSHVLKRSINDHLGKEYITFIKFKQATKIPSSFTKPNEKPFLDTYLFSSKKIMLQEHEKNALEKIKDKELQTILHDFLTRCYYQKLP